MARSNDDNTPKNLAKMCASEVDDGRRLTASRCWWGGGMSITIDGLSALPWFVLLRSMNLHT
jgi:hypothetical protein